MRISVGYIGYILTLPVSSIASGASDVRGKNLSQPSPKKAYWYPGILISKQDIRRFWSFFPSNSKLISKQDMAIFLSPWHRYFIHRIHRDWTKVSYEAEGSIPNKQRNDSIFPNIYDAFTYLGTKNNIASYILTKKTVRIFHKIAMPSLKLP